jgi:hypothetical protein
MPPEACRPARTPIGIVERDDNTILLKDWSGSGGRYRKTSPSKIHHHRNHFVNIPAGFTLAPHSQLINHRGCFSVTAGI